MENYEVLKREVIEAKEGEVRFIDSKRVKYHVFILDSSNKRTWEHINQLDLVEDLMGEESMGEECIISYDLLHSNLYEDVVVVDVYSRFLTILELSMLKRISELEKNQE